MARDKSIIKKHAKTAEKIIALDAEMAKLSDADFINKTAEFKQRIQEGETLDDILVEAFAVCREAAFRALGMKAYKVQLIGGIILHQGDVAEMRTGEGKTLTGLFPAYLNALSGEGVHIVTVNEYLSQRDSEINGQVYSLLGITVGLNGREKNKDQKREAYAQDVTYTTNAELGFDYLRDNMVYDFSLKVQRGLNYAIIDEADSILIDEARTPLIISGGSQNRINLYKASDDFSKTLKEQIDIEFDLEAKQVFLTDEGISKAHEYFSIKNLFDVNNTELFHLIMNALRANFTFKEGVEYTVKDNEIVLIDQFTGRIMPGRAYSDGLQQALQAKEGVTIEEETQTLATVTYQNFYRLYNKLSGMTGTAKTEEEEFIKIYNTRVIVCPTNKPIIRVDEADLTFATKHAKLKRMIEDLKIIHEIGRPVLIGTTSVESSEQISRYLEKSGLPFEMINAKNHHREADIVENAGQRGAITLATNMAGRGTDIKLTDETKSLGGLFVFGIERNEARRIDNQLRGRAGRQGDPGTSRFYISMEDDLMVRFTAPKMREKFLKVLGEDHIKSKMFTRAVTNAQKKLEGLNFDQRKNVLDYDNVLSQHREAMYAQRDMILTQPNLKIVLEKFQYTVAFELLIKNSEIVRGESTLNVPNLISNIDGSLVAEGSVKKEMFIGKEKQEISSIVQKAIMDLYLAKIQDIPEDTCHNMERRTILQAFDKYWTRHINISQKLRSGIYLQQYAQNNPLHEYIEQSSKLFDSMKIEIANEAVARLMNSINGSSSSASETITLNAKPKPSIKIEEKDIDAILQEWGISKEEFNRPNVSKKIEELTIKFKDDKEASEKLQFQAAVIGGLMDELDKILQKHKQTSQEISKEKLDAMVEKFGFKETLFTAADVKAKFETLKDDVEGDELKELIVESQILTALATQLQDAVKSKKPDDDGKEDIFEQIADGIVKTKIG